MLRIATPLAIALALCSQVALAQEARATAAAAPVQDKAAETFNEVERGFFLGVTGGPSWVVNPPALAGGVRPFSSGQMAQLEIGTDIGNILSLSLFVQVTANRAGSDYLGNNPARLDPNPANRPAPVSGDFSTLVPGLALRANLLGLTDAQGTRRTWIYARGGAGYALFYPSQLFKAGPEFLVFAGPGLEYYTRLRHFSIGVEVTATVLATSGAFGFAVTPNLRYAF